ncbi:MAG: squalene/phytoene synthase family protein [Oligoflexia bacterium]|nr:squalene/phytoene synthase family protein [Oligoflexia bacterium]
MNSIDYKHSHQVCSKITQHYSKSFYYLFRFLPEAKRQALYATHAFTMITTHGMKNTHTPGQKQMHFKKCEDIIKRAYKHDRKYFNHAIEPALEQAISRYEIPEKFFNDFLTGVHLSEYFKQPLEEINLIEYCHYAKGCITQIYSMILAHDQVPLHEADSLGIALELSRIAAQINLDQKANKTYVPQTWLENGQVTSKTLDKVVQTAENFNAVAWRGINLLEKDGSQYAATVVSLTTARILRKIKNKGSAVLEKTQQLTFFEKMLILPKSLSCKP